MIKYVSFSLLFFLTSQAGAQSTDHALIGPVASPFAQSSPDVKRVIIGHLLDLAPNGTTAAWWLCILISSCRQIAQSARTLHFITQKMAELGYDKSKFTLWQMLIELYLEPDATRTMCTPKGGNRLSDQPIKQPILQTIYTLLLSSPSVITQTEKNSAFVLAAQETSVPLMKLLLAHGAHAPWQHELITATIRGFKAYDESGYTALQDPARFTALKIVLALGHGYNDHDALYQTVNARYVKAVELLFKLHGDTFRQNSSTIAEAFKSALHGFRVYYADPLWLDMVRLFICAGIPLDRSSCRPHEFEQLTYTLKTCYAKLNLPYGDIT